MGDTTASPFFLECILVTKTQRNVLLFFLLSFPLTWWGFALAWLNPSLGWEASNFPLGPLIAAPIVIWFTAGREGLMRWLKRLAIYRAPLWVYTVSFFVPLGLAVLCIIFAIAAGAKIGVVPTFTFADLVLFTGIVLIAGPLPEEVTFRGHGQHELQEEMSPFTASLWIGLGVLVWHLPLLIWGELPWQIAFAIIAVSVVYAWLYVQGGSLWPLVILHFVVNFFGAGFFQEMLQPESRIYYATFLMIFYVGWAALIYWWHGPQLGRKPREA
jgi:membrane protease YdiL (CAAX protease family)